MPRLIKILKGSEETIKEVLQEGEKKISTTKFCSVLLLKEIIKAHEVPSVS